MTPPLLRRVAALQRVGRPDRRLMARSAALPRTRADDLLTMITRSADKAVLWWVVAGVLAARGGASRRAALRGIGSVGFASLSASFVAKELLPRRRPAASAVPQHRRLDRRPASSSFPSGHAASAAAFITGAFQESPATGVALLPLGAAVAYSRVHTGVHWPTDVGAGAALGVAASFATRHWWPVHDDRPGRTAHRADAPLMVDGEDMLAVVNPASGDPADDPTPEVRFAWPKADLLYPDPDTDLRSQITAEIARRTDTGPAVRALGVAGGDGTVAAVASVAADTGLPLALIPAGTLNHFARDVGVRSMPDADVATEHGSAVGIDLGEVSVHGPSGTHRRWFVNTASLGGYPEMVRLREKIEQRHPKWPSAVIAMIRVLRRAKPFPVRLGGKRALVWLVFVGNGTYAPKGFWPNRRPALDTGLLDVRYLRADVPYSRARFVLSVVTKTLHASRVYRQRDLPALDVELLDGYRRLATDGEIGPLGREFRFRSRPSALTIYRR
ncbi:MULTISPECIES: bifunctional phosphatase PAP2/diacylglycerol kinase family protein [Prauserella salsuginis group]|uniref:Undecaprenyl-diphosphatase n=2 Tax=Prauserella salsuginis group TaxID=2893672 RepID=A0A839XYT1_9PSEU|nr:MULTISPECIES: bifunctional phosphatase PAP2/diacylglycerol kinase family protein [Prauserella salsuginis group]MBB3666268.1 undecaprenyl-diphosphatase [Prauserella sediminis]MCR3718212.1 undecaprenyl-diphosphatase [Prauserella flava]MCR3732782.1 undecaprenyl-diphosphatase [Prauserella salsuginis]